ncbi:MAG: HU family DNA-binding protein [Anaerolineae bacterium]|nr:HU family DNA-binding protein [Anaerolineae bacterium]
MPVKFTVTPRKDPRDQNSQPKYYATAKSSGRADTNAIAKNINSISTVSSVDTAAVLEAFLMVVPDQLAEGKIVELGDFGTFRVGISSEGADLAEGVTARSITDVRVLFTPGKRFKQALDTAEFQKESAN